MSTPNLLDKISAKLARQYRRRGYYLGLLKRRKVPVHPLSFLPNGFSVRQVSGTGVSVVESFCTPEEASYLIEKAAPLLQRSRITINDQAVEDSYRTSETAPVFHPGSKDPALLPLLYRGAMLLGVPHTHVETIFVTRYRSGEYYKAHEDFFEGFHGNRLYTVLIYLNDLPEAHGGETVFERLNLAVQPKLGRAVIWTNSNPDGSGHPETRHEAMPVTPGAEKWVIQLWFRRYKMLDGPRQVPRPPQERPGVPLHGREKLPAGARFSEAVDESKVFEAEADTDSTRKDAR